MYTCWIRHLTNTLCYNLSLQPTFNARWTINSQFLDDLIFIAFLLKININVNLLAWRIWGGVIILIIIPNTKKVTITILTITHNDDGVYPNLQIHQPYVIMEPSTSTKWMQFVGLQNLNILWLIAFSSGLEKRFLTRTKIVILSIIKHLIDILLTL